MVVSLFNWIDYPLQYLSADTTPLDFTCPSNLNETVPRGQTQVFIFWQIPTATDESGTTYQITSSRGPGLFSPGTYDITYVAKDPSENEWSCTFTITVFEREYLKTPLRTWWHSIHSWESSSFFSSSFICFTFHIIDKIRT